MSHFASSALFLLDFFNKKCELCRMERRETVIERLRRVTSKGSDRLAVADERHHLTYRELESLTDGVARQLLTIVKPGEVVAVIADCSITAVVAPLAIMKARCAFAPIYAEWRRPQFEHICRDARIRVAIVDDGLVDLVPETVKTITLSETLDYIDNQVDELQTPSLEDLALIVYTSGSSGQPKGCMLSHRNLALQATNYGFTAEDITASFMPHNSVAFIHDIFGALCVGASIRIMSRDAKDTPATIAEFINVKRATTIILPARVAAEMSAMEFPTLRKMIGVGERWQPRQIPRGYQLYNGYGASEICGGALRYCITELQSTIPVGTALPNVGVEIVDEDLQPCDDGQLAIVGDAVGEGYLNLPKLTAEHFITLRGERVYLTGDRARRLADGNIVIAGRIDRTVKVSGWRVDLQAVEVAMSTQRDVEAAAVRAIQFGQDTVLCGYYQGAIQPEALRDELRQSLPSYMVPTHIMRLEQLPLTASGKIDYPNLPAPQWHTHSDDLPDNLRQLLGIARSVVSAPIADIHTDLVSLGLSSLTALELSVAIEEQMGLQITAASILAFPTVAQISENARLTLNILRKFPVQDTYPLMADQRRMVEGAIEHPDDPKNVMTYAVEVDNVTSKQLEDAINKVFDNHEYLCVQFSRRDGKFVQRCGTERPPIKVIRLSKPCSEADMLAEASPWAILDAPLTRFAIFEAENQPIRLLVTTMHAVSDAASFHILINEIVDACNGKELLPEIIDAYDLTLCEQRFEASEEGARCRKYFEDICAAGYLVDRLNDEKLPAETPGVATFEVDTEVVEGLAHRLAVTPNVLMTTTMMQAIGDLTGHDKLVISTFSNRRNLMAVSRTQGMLLRTLPIVWERSTLAPPEGVRQMQQFFRRLMLCDLYPFCNIADEIGFEMKFLYIYQEELATMTPPAGWHPIALAAPDDATAICCVQVVPGCATYRILIEYNGRTYRRADIERLIAKWRSNIEIML